jgi:hypothetical protein
VVMAAGVVECDLLVIIGLGGASIAAEPVWHDPCVLIIRMNGPTATALKTPISDPARTPFTTRTRLVRILRIATNFQSAVDDTIIDA